MSDKRDTRDIVIENNTLLKTHKDNFDNIFRRLRIVEIAVAILLVAAFGLGSINFIGG